MMLEKDIRIAVWAISWATALNAPPITRSVTGSRSDSGPASTAPGDTDVRPVSRTSEQSISRLPTLSTVAVRPGLITVVESSCWTIAGPSRRCPARSRARSYSGVASTSVTPRTE